MVSTRQIYLGEQGRLVEQESQRFYCNSPGREDFAPTVEAEEEKEPVKHRYRCTRNAPYDKGHISHLKKTKETRTLFRLPVNGLRQRSTTPIVFEQIGFTESLERQGYYVIATCAQVALQAMSEIFPEEVEAGFTVHLWSGKEDNYGLMNSISKL